MTMFGLAGWRYSIVLYGSVVGCVELCRFGKARIGMMQSRYCMVRFSIVLVQQGVVQ